MQIDTSSYLPVLQGLVYNLEYGESYVAYAIDATTYRFVAGDDISVVSGIGNPTITVGTVDYIATYHFDPSGTDKPTLVLNSHSGSYNIPSDGSLVYAELGGYPRLVERRTMHYAEAGLVLALSCCIYFFLSRFRSSLRI